MGSTDTILNTLLEVEDVFAWMDRLGQDPTAMAIARTLHYDMADKAARLLPQVRKAIHLRQDETYS